MKESAGALRGRRSGVEVVEDHEGAWRPQNGKNGGDSKENGRCLAGGVATQTEAAATPAQLTDNDGIQGEEDSAGEQIDGGAVSPHQDMLGHGSSVALSSSTSSFSCTTTSHPMQAVPQLRPPIIRSCREQAPDIHSKYHPPCAGRVGHRVVTQRVANGDVAVNGERHGDPYGGVDGGELQNLHCIVERRRQRCGQNKILQYEVDEDDEEQDEDVGGGQSQEIVVGGLLTTQHQLGQDDHRQDVSWEEEGGEEGD